MISNFSKDDILEALGLQTRGANWLGPLAIGLGAGAFIGVTLALLLTPRSGADLRSELAERGRRIVRRGREAVEEMTAEATDTGSEQRH